MRAGSGQRCRMHGNHTHTHAQSGPMFQLISAQHHPTTEKLQKCLVSHWFHSHGKQNQKANFLATLAQNTNFSLCARERKRQPGHNESNDLLPGQWRHAWPISSNLPLMFFFFFVHVHNLAHIILWMLLSKEIS